MLFFFSLQILNFLSIVKEKKKMHSIAFEKKSSRQETWGFLKSIQRMSQIVSSFIRPLGNLMILSLTCRAKYIGYRLSTLKI